MTGRFRSATATGVVVTGGLGVVGRVVAPETGIVFLAGLLGGIAAGLRLGRYDSPFAVGAAVGLIGVVLYAVAVVGTSAEGIRSAVLALTEVVFLFVFFPVGGVLGAWLADRLTGTSDPPTPSEAD